MIRTIRLLVYLMVAFVSFSFLLTGCVTTQMGKNLYQKGYTHGCMSARVASGERGNNLKYVKDKNLLRYDNYKNGWKEGFNKCLVLGKISETTQKALKLAKLTTEEDRAELINYFTFKKNKAFALNPNNRSNFWWNYGYGSLEGSKKSALSYCGKKCVLFAVNNEIVWPHNDNEADNSANKTPKVEKAKNKPENRPPQLVITEPFVSQSGQKYALKTEQKKIKIAGRAVDEGGVYEVVINGVEAELKQDGYFSAQVPLALGENTIKIIARDNQKLTAQEKITINRLAPVPNPTIKEKRLALIIGNAEYTEGGSLTNPINDARAIASKLKKLNFEVMRKENTTQRSMKKAIDQFGRKLANFDVGLFFYAGHGVQVDGVNYLVPVNANLNSKNDVEYDCVNAGRVLAKMEDAGSKTNIMILDACRDNPFERSWTRSTKGNGLAFMNAPSGSLIAYATSPGKTASDGTDKHGLYTQALLENLSVPNITILEMFQRVRVMVMQASDNQQTPWESTSLSGNFYFTPLTN